MTKISKSIREYLSSIGSRGGKIGGSSKSPAKVAASKANGAKSEGRPRKPDSELTPNALYQRERRKRLREEKGNG